MSVANAWASVNALSMVTWFNHQIVVGQCLVMDTDLLFEYVHPSIQTFVAQSLDNELSNCQSHLLSLSLAHALWAFVCLVHFSFESMSSNISGWIFSESTHVVLSELEFML